METKFLSANTYSVVVGWESFAGKFLKRNPDHGNIRPTREDDRLPADPGLPAAGTAR